MPRLIRKDIEYYSATLKKAKVHCDIAGLGVEGAADKLVDMLGLADCKTDTARQSVQERYGVQERLAALEESCGKRGLALTGGGVAFGGSIAYGLDTPESDVDLRGFVLPPARDILALRDFETLRVEDDRRHVRLTAARRTPPRSP